MVIEQLTYLVEKIDVIKECIGRIKTSNSFNVELHRLFKDSRIDIDKIGELLLSLEQRLRKVAMTGYRTLFRPIGELMI